MNSEELSYKLNKEIDPKLKELWVDLFISMSVHTRGELPRKLLEINRPNEPKEIIQYRLDTYQPITRDPIIKAFNSAYHLIKQSDYKTQVPSKTNDYISVKKFNSTISVNKQNVFDYCLKSVMQMQIEDPNGVIFWDAINYYGGVPNDLPETEQVDIEPVFVQSKNIRYVDNNILLFEYYKIEVEKTTQWVYKVVNDTDIFLYVPIRYDKGELIYELRPYYKHNFGFVPFRVLGGIETIKTVKSDKLGEYGKEITYSYFDSYFTAYNSWANKAIIAASETDAVKVRFSYPYVERMVSPCKSCKGHGSFLSEKCKTGTCGHNGTCEKQNCTSCNGRGVIIDNSPYGVIEKHPANNLNAEINTEYPSVRFYTPPFESIEVNKQYWYEMLDKAEKSISIYQPLINQSGVAKEYDLEQKRDFISIIGDNILDIYEFSLKCISAYLNDDFNSVNVTKPLRYELRSKENISDEIIKTNLINNELSKPLTLEYIGVEYSGNDATIQRILVKYDIYYGYKLQDIAALSLRCKNLTKQHIYSIRMGFKYRLPY